MAIRKPFDYAPHVIRNHGDLLQLTDSRDHPQYLGAGAGIFQSGRYFNGNIISDGTGSTQNSVADRLDAQTFFVRDSNTFDRIGLNTATIHLTAITRLGIYKGDGTNYQPGTLVLDAGTFTGTGGTDEITIAQTLEPGLYYLARLTDTNSIAWTSTGATSSFALLGGTTGAGHYNTSSIYTASGIDVNDPLPDPFPTPTGRVGKFTVFVRAL